MTPRRMSPLAVLALLLAACGGTPTSTPRAAQGAAPPAAVRVGDARVHASAIPTAQLSETVARQYGITRREGNILLLVALRRGPEGNEVAVPATVVATATDLRGRSHRIPMRETRAGGLIDYIGTVETSLPDTLRFDLQINVEGAGPSTLRFSREFFPQ